MADSRSFVHFSHPGREQKPDRGCGKVWNTSTRSHIRKFMQLRGECTKGDGSGHNGDLLATRCEAWAGIWVNRGCRSRTNIAAAGIGEPTDATLDQP